MPDREARDQAHRTDDDDAARDYDERTSLAPLDFETAMKGLLAVKPDQDAADEDSDTEDH